MKEDQSIDRGLEIMKFFALLMFLYSIVAFMRPWPYPLKAGLSLLKSAVRIDTPVFLYIILGAFLLFSVVFNLLGDIVSAMLDPRIRDAISGGA